MAALTIGSPDPVYVVPLTSNGNGTATDGARTYPVGSPVPVYVVSLTSSGNGTAADGANILTVGSPAPIYVVPITDNGNGTATDGGNTLTIGSRAPIYVVPITGNGNGTATDGARTLTVGSPVPVYVVSLASGSVAYTGPGDIVSGATAWYGLRGYSAAYAAPGTNKAINIRRASDNAVMDIVIKADGTLDVAAAATFCNATTGYITTVYDQSGHANHASQVTAANQPQLVFNGLGSLPCIGALVGTNQGNFTGAITVTPATGVLSENAIGKRVGTSQQEIIGYGDTNQLGVAGAANFWQLGFGASGFINVSSGVTDGVFHIANGVFNGASSVFNIDGVDTTGNITGNTLARQPVVISINGANGFFLAEAGIWDNIVFSGPNITSMYQNQKTYWGL